MNIALYDESRDLFCPECYNKETITIHEVFIYCANCGLELVNPYPDKSDIFKELEMKDKERYNKFKELEKERTVFISTDTGVYSKTGLKVDFKQ